MTGHTSNTADSVKDDEWTVTDPAAVAERRGVAFERRTYEHDTVEHCETDAAGRAIIGVTDPDGRVLIVAQSQEGHAVLPNETVDPDGDWASVGRERIEGMAGVEVTLNEVRLVREVEHHIDGEPRSRTYHVVFGAALTNPSAPIDGLCDDNPWDLCWIDAVPDWLPDDDPHGVHSDIQLFVEEGT